MIKNRGRNHQFNVPRIFSFLFSKSKSKNKELPTDNTLLWLILLIIFFIVIYHRWFLTLDIFTWGDWGFYYPETIKEWLTLPRLWIDSYGIGMVDLGLSLYIPARLLYGTISNIGASILVDRLVYLFPGVLLPVIGIFILTKSIIKNNIAAFVASIVYNLNTYILLLNSGHLTLSISFSLFPYIFIYFHKALSNKSFKYALICGLFSITASTYEVRAFYLSAVLLFFYLLYYIYYSGVLKLGIKSITRCFLVGSIPMFMTLTTNLYWLLGFLKTASSFSGIVYNRELYGIGLLPLQRVFTLFSPYWTGSHEFAWGTIQMLPLYFWLIPLFTMMGFWFSRHNKRLLFWAFVYLLGTFLAKLTGEPFAQVYPWLYNHFPGFNAFRESSKFNLYVSLSTAILIASFVAEVLKSNLKNIIKYSITIAISLVFIFNARPIVTGELARLLTPRVVPTDYLVLKSFITKQNDYFRTLHVPADSRWGYWDQLHPKINMATLVKSDWQKINNYSKTGLQYSAEDEILGLLENPNANKILDMASVKYIVIPPMDLANEDDFTFMYAPRQHFIDRISKLPYLKKIEIGTSELLVYENTEYLPQIYSDSKLHINFEKYSTTEYQVHLPPEYKGNIILSQAYNSGWKIRLGNFSWIKSLLDKEYFLSDSIHKDNLAGLNEFTMPDSAQSQTVTLYFAPQAWINIGSIISFSCLIIYLTILWRLVRR